MSRGRGAGLYPGEPGPVIQMHRVTEEGGGEGRRRRVKGLPEGPGGKGLEDLSCGFVLSYAVGRAVREAARA